MVVRGSRIREQVSVRLNTRKQRRQARDLLMTSEAWVFSRTACLGNDVYGLLSLDLPRLNMQKGRADHLLSGVEGPPHPPIPMSYYRHLQRRDVWPLIVQQEYQWWAAHHPPRFILMDSYSELTDQFFADSSGGPGFFSNFGDVALDPGHNSDLSPRGLLDLDGVGQLYGHLFEVFHSTWPDVPVLFVHYPTHRESRPKFLRRAELIRLAIESVSTRDPLLTSVNLATREGKSSGLSCTTDDFPYHYDADTYDEFAQILRRSIPAN